MKFVSIFDMEITHPDLQAIINTAVSWSARRRQHPSASMVLLGPNGTGKTMLAQAMLWTDYYEVDGRPLAYRGSFFKASKFLAAAREREIEELIPPPIDTPDQQFPGCPIVVLDDVGDNGQLEFINAQLMQSTIHTLFTAVVEHCANHGISLIITGSNNVMTRTAMAEYIGPRAWKRLEVLAPKEGDLSYIVSFGQVPDYRPKLSGRNNNNGS